MSPPLQGGDGPGACHEGEPLRGVGRCRLERSPLVVPEGFNRLSQVFDEMKPIDDLHGVGGSPANALGVERTPITTDDQDGRMLREPGGHTLCRALGQQGQDPMILQIDEDRPIALPAPPRPLIDPKPLWGGDVRRRGHPSQPQEGVGIGPPLEAGREPGACLATEGQAEGAEVLGEPQRPSRPRGRHGGQAFRKNLAWTRRMVTEKLPHADLQTHGVSAPRHLSDGTCLAAVDSRGLHVAERARDPGGCCGDVEHDLSGRVIHVARLQRQPRLIW